MDAAQGRVVLALMISSVFLLRQQCRSMLLKAPPCNAANGADDDSRGHIRTIVPADADRSVKFTVNILLIRCVLLIR